jgi:hypothetical protein
MTLVDQQTDDGNITTGTIRQTSWGWLKTYWTP